VEYVHLLQVTSNSQDKLFVLSRVLRVFDTVHYKPLRDSNAKTGYLWGRYNTDSQRRCIIRGIFVLASHSCDHGL